MEWQYNLSPVTHAVLTFQHFASYALSVRKARTDHEYSSDSFLKF